MQLHRTFISHISSILFTPHCVSCSAFTTPKGLDDEYLCSRCFLTISRRNGILCPACGRRKILGVRGGSPAHSTCMLKRPFSLVAATTYRDPIASLCIHHLKYRSVHDFALPLARLITEQLRLLPSSLLKEAIVIPVPLHSRRQRQRGFNQSALIGKHIARILNLDYDEHIIIRNRSTRRLAALPSRKARFSEIAGAFSIADSTSIAGATILLVDDVFTSGATMSEAARLLRRQGARRIIGAVAATADDLISAT